MGKRPFSERTTTTKQLHLVYIYGHPLSPPPTGNKLPRKRNSLFVFVFFASFLILFFLQLILLDTEQRELRKDRKKEDFPDLGDTFYYWLTLCPNCLAFLKLLFDDDLMCKRANSYFFLSSTSFFPRLYFLFFPVKICSRKESKGRKDCDRYPK